MSDAMGEENSRSSTPGDLTGDGGNQSTASPAQPGSASELREDQIQNAIAFLSHPKVRGSPKASKVSFLRQKGLTETEIEEAFRRVPETPVPALPTTTQQPKSTLPTIANHVAPQQQLHYPQHSAQPIAMQQQQQPVRWSQVALGAGFAAASAYAVKSLVWPFVADKYTAWKGTSSTSISTRTRNDADLASSAPGSSSDVNAVANAIRAQTAELASSIDELKALIADLDKKRPASPEDKVTASELRQELHTIAASLNEIVASPRHTTAAGPTSLSLETELSEIKNLLSEYLKTPRSGEHTPPGELNRTTTTPGSFSSAQDQPLSEAPSPIQLGNNNSNNTTRGNTSNAFTPTSGSTVTNPTTNANSTNVESGRHPASYMEVLEMLERGETPPGIRTDINDKPPNPKQSPPQSMMKPLPKPWEQRQQKQQVGGDGGGSVMTPISQNFRTEALMENASGGTTFTHGEDTSDDALNLSPVVPDDALQHPHDTARVVPSSSSPARTNQQGQQRQQQRPESGNSAASPLTAAGSKGATSIFEAATSSQGSPGVIAGRLSPSSDQRKGTTSADGGGRGIGVAIPTSLFTEQYTTNALSTTNGEENKHDGVFVGAGRPPRVTTTTPVFPDEGGIGRPTSRGWRPPPIPVPTLPENTSNPALGAGVKAGGGAHGSATSGSQNSLGADFAAA